VSSDTPWAGVNSLAESDTEKGPIGAPLTVGMKATMGLILAFAVFLAATSVATLLAGGPWDIYATFGTAIFLPLLAVFFVFGWKRKPWAYVGTIILGGVVVVGSAPSLPATVGQQISPLLLWVTMLATVLGLLMALEGFKAYSELRQAKS